MNAITTFMKRNYKILLVLLALSLSFCAFTNSNNDEKDKLLLELLTFVIERGHYNPAAIDDKFSKGVYKDYIEALDPSKRFFLQSDIDEFSKYENQIDNEILNKDLTFFNLTYDRLILRLGESKVFYKEILDKPFDYSVKEDFNTDYEKLPYAKNTEELKEKWRKQIKLSTLSSLTDKIEIQENLKNGVVAEKVDEEEDSSQGFSKTNAIETDENKKDAATPEKLKTFAELEVETRESSLKSLNQYFEFVSELKKDDWFSVYINAIAAGFDPHTNYFPADEKDRFDVSMSGKLEGIGAKLQKKNDYTEITDVISGGPAWKGKELEAGDVILKVAQGKGEPVDVVGMQLDEVVKKIKGPKGTVVKLTVKKKIDNTIVVISIERDIVELEETYAKSSVVEKDGMKYGIIYLPKFYIDFENPDGRDAGKDMAIEVERLKKEGVQGIIVDVRDDGGGSLKTVVDIAGLFIESGPIVQIKSAGRKKEVLYDRDPKVEWDGPLVIMVNSFSASASEILAAAIQDYRRGIILGSKQTYGKGTVQNVIDLNQFVRNSEVGDLGALKTTTQKFYRINGGSTQLEGVSSDVVMPDRYAYLKMGERDMENAMPWDKIDAAPYTFWNKQNNFDTAIEKSKKRIAAKEELKLIEENAKWIDERNKENVFSLNIDQFTADKKRIEELSKKYKSISKYENNLKFESLPYEVEAMKVDVSLKEKRERWHESLSKDIYVEEALNVLEDLQSKGTSNKSVTVKKDKLVKS